MSNIQRLLSLIIVALTHIVTAEFATSCRSPKQLALTFDDGPISPSTDNLLDVLKHYNVSATFFVLGSQVNQFPHVLKRAHREGHLIGSHTWSHDYLTKMSEWQIRDEVKRASDAVLEVTGVRPKYLRPPYGDYNEFVGEVLESMDVVPVKWSLDSRDWELQRLLGDNAGGNIYSNVASILDDSIEIHHINNPWVGTRSTTAGYIVLFHDIYQSTVREIPRIIELGKRKGFEFVTIDKCLEEPEEGNGLHVDEHVRKRTKKGAKGKKVNGKNQKSRVVVEDPATSAKSNGATGPVMSLQQVLVSAVTGVFAFLSWR